MKNKNLLKFFLTISLFFSTIGSVSAASTITAIPPRLELLVSPGETVNSILKVDNGSEASQNYTIFVDDFIVNDLLGTPIPLSENVSSKWSLRKWITAPSFVPVDAKTTQTVNITIKVPTTALPGGHYAMITYQPNAEVKPGEMKKTAAIIGQRVGTLVYVTVKGKVNEKANITSFTVPKFTEKGPVEFTGSIENLSDIHLQPKGSISISNLFNQEIAKIPVQIGNIFPENSKLFTSVWNQKWGYGRYRADLNLLYGSKDTVLYATIFFWLFPIRLVIYTLVALVSILVIIILLSKKGKRHQEELEREVQELQKEIQDLEHKK